MPQNLIDIAKELHLSQATVSRAINNKPGVSQKTRELVLRTMQQMGVSPATTRNKDCGLIALVTPDLANPIFPRYVTQINNILAQQNMLPILCTYTFEGVTQENYLHLLQTLSVDGAIFLAGNYDNVRADHSIYSWFSNRIIPMAFLNASNHDQPGFYAETDDAGATQMALKHLVDLGHKKIGLLLGDQDHYPTMQKYSSAIHFFDKHGINHSPVLTQWTTYGINSGVVAAQSLIRNGATAIFCASDQLAIGAIKAAHEMGKSVPDDLSVIGYDDSPQVVNLTPPLTSVRQPVAKLSQALVHGIMTMMHNPDIAVQKNVLKFQPELIVRGSTAPAH